MILDPEVIMVQFWDTVTHVLQTNHATITNPTHCQMLLATAFPEATTEVEIFCTYSFSTYNIQQVCLEKDIVALESLIAIENDHAIIQKICGIWATVYKWEIGTERTSTQQTPEPKKRMGIRLGGRKNTSEPTDATVTDTGITNTSTDTPSALEEYRRIFGEFAHNGVLEEWEQKELEILRNTLHITNETHQKILLEYSVIEGVPFELEIEQSSCIHHVVGIRGECDIKLHANIDLHTLEVYWYSATDEGVVQEFSFSHLRPKRPRIERISVVPPLPGRYSVDIVCQAILHSGQKAWFRCSRPIALLVQEDNGQISSNSNWTPVSIDGRTEESWQGVQFDAIDEVQARDWHMQKTKRSSKSSGLYTHTKPPDKTTKETTLLQLCTGESIRNFVWTWMGGEQKRFYGTIGEEFSLGSNLEISAQQLIIEPIEPQSQYIDNIRRSQRISRQHLHIKSIGGTVHATNFGSNGSSIGSKALQKGESCVLSNHANILIANDLLLQAKLYRDTANRTSVHLLRLNNFPVKSHFLLSATVGLWEDKEWLLGAEEGASILLQDKDGDLCLVNHACENICINGEPLPIHHYTPLKGKEILLQFFQKVYLIQRKE